MKQLISGLTLSVLMLGSANAALLGRAGGLAYYDDVLDITWLADANLAASNSFGVTGISANGTMRWQTASEWIGAMNAVAYLGTSDWRLPNTVDTGEAGCVDRIAYIGMDCGYNVDLSTGEMAHMFYSTLGNLAYYNVQGIGPQLNSGLINTGPFSNLQSSPSYWSGTTYAPVQNYAWYFYFSHGGQGYFHKHNYYYAWAVRPGDIGAVPAPGAFWLFGTGLLALGAKLRCRKVSTAGTIA